jgi:hypothetical protein
VNRALKTLYFIKRIQGDAKAIARGKYRERLVRRFIYRHAHRGANLLARKVLAKVFGL